MTVNVSRFLALFLPGPQGEDKPSPCGPLASPTLGRSYAMKCERPYPDDDGKDDAASNDKEMENLVETEHPWKRVRPAASINDRAKRVEETAEKQQGKNCPGHNCQEGRQSEKGDPAH